MPPSQRTPQEAELSIRSVSPGSEIDTLHHWPGDASAFIGTIFEGGCLASSAPWRHLANSSGSLNITGPPALVGTSDIVVPFSAKTYDGSEASVIGCISVGTFEKADPLVGMLAKQGAFRLTSLQSEVSELREIVSSTSPTSFDLKMNLINRLVAMESILVPFIGHGGYHSPPDFSGKAAFKAWCAQQIPKEQEAMTKLKEEAVQILANLRDGGVITQVQMDRRMGMRIIEEYKNFKVTLASADLSADEKQETFPGATATAFRLRLIASCILERCANPEQVAVGRQVVGEVVHHHIESAIMRAAARE